MMHRGSQLYELDTGEDFVVIDTEDSLRTYELLLRTNTHSKTRWLIIG